MRSVEEKIDSRSTDYRKHFEKRRWRHRRLLWLAVGAFVTSGTIASISPPAYSPTRSAAPELVAISPITAGPTVVPTAMDGVDSDTADRGALAIADITRVVLDQHSLADATPAANDSKAFGVSQGYEARLARIAGTIERSLFDDGQEAGLSDRLIMELAEIFGWDIDFVLDLHHGDRFAVLYEEKYWRGRKVADGDILAAEFINQGQSFRAIGHRASDGRMEYYSPDGFALRRAFLRTPVKFSRVSSLFSISRYHPILKAWRAHNGVDYDAPLGTPVRATAGGHVVTVGRVGGYGNMIAIRHAGPYRTLYAHLSRFRTGLRAGQTVEQGEIIGYVGRTGLATAPHLHYELQVNGVHRDPLTFKLPLSARTRVPFDSRGRFFHDAAVWIAELAAADHQIASATPK